MSAKFYEEIIDNYKKLYETKEGYDIKIYVGEKPNIKEFHVHSFILKTQSKFFKTAFTEDVQKNDGYYILNSNNSSTFEILLRYVFDIILKRDDFDIDDEIIIWENLLKWACGQNPAIQQEINKWNKNEFTVMERRISRFIPSVRFYHILSEDFLLKVYPFKELLPND